MIPLEDLFELLPPSQLERLAVQYELDSEHSVKLSGPAVFLCVLNGLLNHEELSQRLLEETYHQQTGQRVDHSSFSKALGRLPPAYFAGIYAFLRKKVVPQAQPGELRALRLRRVDATTITLSAKLLAWGLLVGTCAKDKARRHLKRVFELDAEGWPELLHVCKDKSENADSVALGVPMREHSQPGDMWIFDSGCHGRQRLLDIHNQKAYFLTPLSQQHVRVDQVLWEADPAALPSAPPPEDESPFVMVRVETGVFENSQPTTQWDPMPLILVHGLRYDRRKKQWKALVLMTNLPLSEDGLHAGPYTFWDLAELYRWRWEIEVFFKFIKQHTSYAHLTSRQENGIETMLYMSLITAVLLIWYQRQTGIDRGWRSVKFWLAADVREWTRQLLGDKGLRVLLGPGLGRAAPTPLWSG